MFEDYLNELANLAGMDLKSLLVVACSSLLTVLHLGFMLFRRRPKQEVRKVNLLIFPSDRAWALVKLLRGTGGDVKRALLNPNGAGRNFLDIDGFNFTLHGNKITSMAYNGLDLRDYFTLSEKVALGKEVLARINNEKAYRVARLRSDAQTKLKDLQGQLDKALFGQTKKKTDLMPATPAGIQEFPMPTVVG